MLMAENNFTKMAGNVLAVLALCGAAASAYQVGNTLAWAGIVYYLICIAAIVFRYSGAKYVAWGAVGFHVVMVSYALWNWQTAGVRPCHFCFIAAGLALLAAVALQRLPLAVLPVTLIVAGWLAWPNVFAAEKYTPPIEDVSLPVGEVIPGTNNEQEPAGGNDGAATAGSVEKPSTSTTMAGRTATVSKGATKTESKPSATPRKTDSGSAPDSGTGSGTNQPGDTPTQSGEEPGSGDGTEPGNQNEPEPGTGSEDVPST